MRLARDVARVHLVGMVRTYGLTHLALGVRDAERAFRFYAAVLGAVAVSRGDGWVQAQTPGTHDVLVFEEGAQRAGTSGGIAHFGFRLTDPADIDAAARAVEAAGGTVTSRGEFVPGEPYVFFRDPDGYVGELWYEIPTPVDLTAPPAPSAAHERRVGELVVSSDPARVDLDAVHAVLRESNWSPGIPRETVAAAIAGSIPFGVYDGDRQIGFARVITDRATFAYLADVYVLESHRGRGIGRELVATVMSHPALQQVRRFLLVTRDASALYAPFGFTPLAHPDRFMEIARGAEELYGRD